MHRRARGRGTRLLLAALALAFLALPPTQLKAQQEPIAVIAPGEAAVTGFAGAPPPPQIAPGDDPAALTFIDTSGPSLRIIDIRHMGGPATAQLVGAPKPFTVQASEIGQVFAVALDDASPPNIYVAASSSYGLPIVAAGPDGRMLHIRRGAPNAAFMQGLWGQRGGPGSIWKIDGASARVSLFANVTTGSRPNSGAGLGGLAFDPQSKSLFVADRETGLIHRLGLNGADLGSYDHGVTGRAAQEMAAVPWATQQQSIDITSPSFDSGDPATWNLALPKRRVFGLAVHEGRLFYAVADGLQVWSVGLRPDGAFGEDAFIELEVPPAAGPTEISKVAFDAQGRMLIAERPAPTGAFDLEALSQSSIGRVLRYAIMGEAAGRRVWQEQPDEYALGFPQDYRNGNGGVEVGYNYDRNGDIIAGSCGGFVWMSGEDLRESADPTLEKRLAQSGPLPVSGLQGVGAWQDRPRNVPPIDSYFVSYSDGPAAAEARGHMGDIAIPRCEAASHAGLGTVTTPAAVAPPPGGPPAPPVAPPAKPPNGPPLIPPKVRHPPPPPPGSCQPDEVRRIPAGSCTPSCPRPDIQIGNRCCSVATLAANAECSNSACPAGQTPIGPSNFCCDSSHVYTGSGGAPACCAGLIVNGRCEPPKPPPCPPGGPVTAQCPCPSGYVKAGASCCLANNVTSTGVCCPPGQAPGPNKDTCLPILRIPIGHLCCVAGRIPTASGMCCPPANVTTTGVCCSQPLDPSNRAACPARIQSVPACAPGYAKMPDGSCCNQRFVSADGRSCLAGRQPCGPGEFRNAQGGCERRAPPVVVSPPPAVQPQCPAGEVLTPKGRCAPLRAPPCAPGQIRMRNGVCAPLPPPRCPRGQARAADGSCMPIAPPPCPPGTTRAPNGVCAPLARPPCPPGLMRNLRGICVPVPCPRGTIRNRAGVCVPFPGPGTFPPAPGEFGPPRGPGFPSPGGTGFGPGAGPPHPR